MGHKAILALLSDTDYERVEPVLHQFAAHIEHCDTLQSATARLHKKDHDVLILDLEQMDAHALELLSDVAQKHVDISIITLSSIRDRDQMAALFSQPFARHLVGKNGTRETTDLQTTLTCLQGSPIDTLRHGLKDTATSLRVRIAGSTDKAPLLSQVAEVCRSFKMNSRLVNMAQGVADELITNAIYNAPTRLDGTRPYSSLDRSNQVKLSPAEQPEFHAQCDENTLLLAVIDPFGSLAADTVRRSIARGFAGDHTPLESNSGGAGLGFFQIGIFFRLDR